MGKQRASLILVALLLVLLGGWWLLEVRVGSGPMSALNSHTPVIVHHSHSGGLHTYTGTVSLGSACAILSSGIVASGQNPAHITLMLSADIDSTCRALAAPPQGSFTLTYEASATSTDVVFDGVTVDGAPAPYTLVED